jgi:pyruvate, water dikinase
MRILILFVIIMCLGATLLVIAQNNPPKKNISNYISIIKDTNDFNNFKGESLSNIYADVQSIKLCYVLKTKKLYFINSNKFRFHIDFISKIFSYNKDIAEFNFENYGNTTTREFILGTLNYYTQQNKYTLEFVSEDDLPLKELQEMYPLLTANFQIDAPIYLLLNSNYLVSINSSLPTSIPVLFPEQIYSNQISQPLVLGTSYGIARKFGTQKSYINDIVFLNGTPIALPHCKGIITDAFQTPLSHINVLCNNRNTPAAVMSNYDSLLSAMNWYDKPIELKVSLNGVKISPISAKILDSLVQIVSPKKSIILFADTVFKLLPNFSSAVIKNNKAIGGKAYGLNRLYNIQKKHPNLYAVPKNAFAIPFYYYSQHIKNPTTKKWINILLNKESINDSMQKQVLKKIRQSILEMPLDKKLLAQVNEKLRLAGANNNFRFRSSSNAEDADGFNGAGLYKSYTGSLKDSSKNVERAIKKVWASVWSEAAFIERNIFGIDNRTVFMAILVHHSFPNEDANGVAITKNLYRNNFPGMTINVQKNEVSVVDPPDSISCDQFVCLGSEDFTGTIGDVYVQYITRSNINNSQNVLSQKQIKKLYLALKQIKDYFYASEKASVLNKYSFDNYALDLEFKFINDELFIKQVRAYK